MSSSALAQKAMLAKLSVRQIAKTKKDKGVSRDIHQYYGLGIVDTGYYMKDIFTKKSLLVLRSVVSSARAKHHLMTMPWHDNEFRLLPATRLMAYTNEMNGFKTSFEAEVKSIKTKYPAMIQEAQARLGKIFNIKDYPDILAFDSIFDFKVSIRSVPESDDFRVEVSEAQKKKIKDDIEKEKSEAILYAQNSLWKRLYEQTNRIADILQNSNPSAIKNAMVENTSAMVSLVTDLNVFDNKDLDFMCKDISKQLTSYAGSTLREDERIRALVAQNAVAISDRINSIIQNGGITQ